MGEFLAAFDVNGDGEISVNELLQGMKRLQKQAVARGAVRTPIGKPPVVAEPPRRAGQLRRLTKSDVFKLVEAEVLSDGSEETVSVAEEFAGGVISCALMQSKRKSLLQLMHGESEITELMEEEYSAAFQVYADSTISVNQLLMNVKWLLRNSPGRIGRFNPDTGRETKRLMV